MDIQDTTMTVADYCRALERDEIAVNPKYQRSPKVWPAQARSFLIETILLGYPIPKLSLHQRTNVRSRETVKDVVDGQQRTRAIRDFYLGDLRLAGNLELAEARGKVLGQLDEDLQQAFLEYGLNFDVFVGTTEREVREVFRRMNSFTVPLNAEEHRHAVFQGDFKWFVYKLGGDYADALMAAGVLTPRQVIRMADAKLVTEVIHACLNGIETTNKRKLDDLYRSRDDDFPEKDDLDRRLRSALDRFIGWSDLTGTPLTKHYNVYALLLACIHVDSPLDTLAPIAPEDLEGFAPPEEILVNLTLLADQLENDEPDEEFKPFAKAAAERTNVAAQRATRFQYFCRALGGLMP